MTFYDGSNLTLSFTDLSVDIDQITNPNPKEGIITTTGSIEMDAAGTLTREPTLAGGQC